MIDVVLIKMYTRTFLLCAVAPFATFDLLKADYIPD